MLRFRTLIALAASVVVARGSLANDGPVTVFYVDDDSLTPGDGLSWATAFDTLNDGISAAFQLPEPRCAEIRVAQGRYSPGMSTNDTFNLLSGVAMLGGYAGVTEVDPDTRDLSLYVSLLDGDRDEDGLDNQDNENVVTGDDDVDAVIDGFTITGGSATFRGGGLEIAGGVVVISRCVVYGNCADMDGGAGVSVRAGADITIQGCVIFGNVTGPDCDGAGSGTVGGGVLIDGETSVVTMFNTTVAGNLAETTGGLQIDEGTLELYNCVFWGNGGATEVHQIGGVYSAFNTTIQGAIGAIDPLFVDPDGPDNTLGTADDDYRLQFGSPAADAGDNGVLALSYAADLDSNPRIADDPLAPGGLVVDLGPYENNAPAMFTTSVQAGAWSDDATWSADAPDAATAAIVADDVTVAASSSADELIMAAGGSLEIDAGVDLAVDSLQMAAGTTLAVAMTGDLVNGSAGSLTVAGEARLAGTLKIVFAPGFVLEPGHRYELITADSIVGTFDTIMLPAGTKFQIPMFVQTTETAVIFYATASVLHVDDDAPPGGDGLTWDTAYTYLQDALADPVLQSRLGVRVAQGTYRPDQSSGAPGGSNDPSLEFDLPSLRTIEGGFGGITETFPDLKVSNPTTLTGEIGLPGTADNSYHVVSVDGANNAELIDVVVRDGNAAGGFSADRDGGGMTVRLGGSATIRGCTFLDNTAMSDGGALAVGAFSSVVVEQCTFEGNSSTFNGGAVWITSSTMASFDECTFTLNTSEDGGAIYAGDNDPIVLTRCTFDRNHATRFAGVLYAEFDAEVHDCRFLSNSSMDGVATLRMPDGTVTNSAFTGNDGHSVVRILGSVPVINCSFTGNITSPDAVLVVTDDAILSLYNSIVVGNGGSFPQTLEVQNNGQAFVEYSILDDSIDVFLDGDLDFPGGPVLLDVDPLFVDADGLDDVLGTLDDDLRVLIDSPAIDAGSNPLASGVVGALDLAGNPRSVDLPDVPNTGDVGAGSAIIDMGAYEAQGSIDFENAQNFDSGLGSSNREDTGDLDGDGDIDVAIIVPSPDGVLPGVVQIFINDGVVQSPGDYVGLLPLAMTIDVGIRPTGIVVNDFNNDGRADIAVINGDPDPQPEPEPSGELMIFLNAAPTVAGAASPPDFDTPDTVPIDGDPCAIDSGRLSGDEYPDLAVASRDADDMGQPIAGRVDTYIYDDKSGNFQNGTQNPVGEDPLAIGIGPGGGEEPKDDDTNEQDIYVADGGSDDLWVLRNQESGTFSTPPPVPLGRDLGPVDVALGDLDGDGVVDVATANQTDQSVTIILQNDDFMTFDPPANVDISQTPKSIEAADLDDDTDLDLAVVTEESKSDEPSVQILLNGCETCLGGSVSFAAPVSIPIPEGPNWIVSADLNGDGASDLVTVNDDAELPGDSGGSVTVLLNAPCPTDANNDGATAQDDLIEVILNWGACPIEGPCVADFNDDGMVNVDDLVEAIVNWGPCGV